MNCPYCQQPCKLDDRSKFAQVKAKNGWQHWECSHHRYKVLVAYNHIANQTYYTFYTSHYKEHQYRIRCIILDDHRSMELLVTDSDKTLIEFPFINHNINPDNI